MQDILGFWLEYRKNTSEKSLGDEAFGQDYGSLKEKIIQYLQGGINLLSLRTIFYDIKDKDEMGVPVIYTDGEWLWTTEYIYYIDKYDLKIDQAFLKYLLNRSFKLPTKEDIGMDRIIELEDSISGTYLILNIK